MTTRDVAELRAGLIELGEDQEFLVGAPAAQPWRGMRRLIAHSAGIKILMEFNPRRCGDPLRMLAEMAALFPLREVNFDGRTAPCSPGGLLARGEETMLYLSKANPA